MLLIFLFFLCWPTPSANGQSFTRAWDWQFAGQKVRLTVCLDSNLLARYRADNVADRLKSRMIYNERHWQNEYAGELVRPDTGDTAVVASLISQSQQLAANRHWSKKQLLNFLVSFVRQLPNDDDKWSLRRRLGSRWLDSADSRSWRPAETLARGQGLCQDKSVLLYCLLRKAGWGVCLYLGQSDCADMHMGVGVSDGHGYLYIETMMNLDIGQTPTVSSRGLLRTGGCALKIIPLLATIGEIY